MSDSFANPWTIARQGPLSVGFPRLECWSGLPFPSPGGVNLGVLIFLVNIRMIWKDFELPDVQASDLKSGTLGWNPNREIFKAPHMISLCDQFEKKWTNILLAYQPHLMTH